MICAVVLTHNDEEMLGKTLQSLTWCDEIIIVDDRSIDKTVAIAKKFTDKIFTRFLNNDFARQRNFGLAKARGDWVLFVDSDEVVTEELAKEIQVFVSSRGAKRRGDLSNKHEIASPSERSRNDKSVGYYVKRKDIMWGRELKHGEQGRMKLLRLAKKDAGKWIRPVHEVWSPYAKASGDKRYIGELKEPLLHFPHPKVAQYLEEINRYSTLNAQYLFGQGVRVHWWDIVLYPTAKFFVNYFLRLGFLDGTPGAVAAIMMSLHSFLSRSKLWQLWDTHEKPNSSPGF